MNILTSKKGNKISKEELLDSLQSANAEKNLSILYKEGKPTLVHKYNEQGPLELITASVIFPMLINKFVMEKSEAYTLASWLSENFSKKQEQKQEQEDIEEKMGFLQELSENLAVSKKATKAELFETIAKLQRLVDSEIAQTTNKL